ncbi:MAG: trypsin-like serine protease [Bacteroidetes bacterium]|jgi:hypothetical protein|nr:trypsin-like serine protease [Bacteroidota bacterium]
MYLLRLLIVIFFISGVLANAQPGKIVPKSFSNFSEIPVITLPSPDSQAITPMQQASASRFKNKIFARLISTDIFLNKQGVWKKHNGYRVWSLGIFSPGAEALTFKLKNVNMHAGAELYLYKNDLTEYQGPYTRHDVSNYKTLLTPPIKGALIYIEYRVPDQQLTGSFEIKQVGHALPDIFKDSRYQLSDYCHSDVNCFTDPVIQQLKKGICRILINNNEYCTGILINNTEQDGKPYVLTAHHCIETASKARNSLFHFNYESPFCDGPDATFKTIVGAEMIATTENLDFTLVELAQKPNFLLQPYYTGWNNQAITPENVFSIHHPQGDVKKVAFDYDQLFVSNFGEGFDDAAHWWVSRWEEGTTEKGSSGSPLFNNNGEVIGVLSGGSATCESPESDFYQRFDVAWDKYSEADEQLKAWLDPDGLGILSFPGFDPYESIKATADTLSNFLDEEPLQLLDDDFWGYVSGHSSLGNTKFAEEFVIHKNRTFFGINMHLAKAFTANDSSRIVIKIWSGENKPNQVMAEQEYLLDFFGADETQFIQWESPVSLDSGKFYVGYEIHYQSQPTDTFALYHSPSRSTEESNTAYAFDGSQWHPMNYYYPFTNISLGIKPVVFDSLPVKVDTPFQPGQKIFRLRPVPAINKVTIDLEEFYSQSVLGTVYNSQGKLVHEFRIEPNNSLKELSTVLYPNGIYIVRLNINGEYYHQKFTVAK